jgi:thymidylate synthase (FAD)
MSNIKINVLDKGFVELVDSMGNDMRVIQAARVSTGGDITKGDKKDRGLIRYLMMNEHWTPFEKIVFEFHIKCPIFVARQWMRHRISSYNEASGRYKKFEWECYEPDVWREQDTTNKQGSIGKITDELNKQFTDNTRRSLSGSKWAYENNLHYGAAREQARIVMPLAQYTEFFWTVNFRSLANFITLRSDSHAQQEIQDYANALHTTIGLLEDMKWTVEIFNEMLELKRAMAKSIENDGIRSTIAKL